MKSTFIFQQKGNKNNDGVLYLTSKLGKEINKKINEILK